MVKGIDGGRQRGSITAASAAYLNPALELTAHSAGLRVGKTNGLLPGRHAVREMKGGPAKSPCRGGGTQPEAAAGNSRGGDRAGAQT
jgi:hypothetical protein